MDDTSLLLVAGAAYAFVPLLMRFPRVAPAAVGLMIVLANVLVTLAVWFSGESSSIYAYFYVWATPLAFAFFPLRYAAAHLALAGMLYGGILAIVPTESGSEPGRWLMTMGTVAVAGLLVRAITQALRDESEQLERERRQRAMEINDNVVQGLVLAKAWSERGLPEQSQKAVSDALAKAQGIIDDLLGDDPAQDGSLRREAPADPR
jgi:hypothetical protein